MDCFVALSLRDCGLESGTPVWIASLAGLARNDGGGHCEAADLRQGAGMDCFVALSLRDCGLESGTPVWIASLAGLARNDGGGHCEAADLRQGAGAWFASWRCHCGTAELKAERQYGLLRSQV